MASLQELLDQQAAINRQIAELKNSSRGQALEQIKKLMAEHGLTAADVSGTPARKASSKALGSRAKVAAKYRHPESGATWSGRGLKPKWLSGELAKGKTLEDFAV